MFLFKVNETLVPLNFGTINISLNFEPAGTITWQRIQPMTEKWTISNQNTDLPLEKCKNWKFLVKINEFQFEKTPILRKTTSYNFQFRQQNVKRNHFFQNQRDFRVKTPTFQKSTNS